jgi:hypothetical protein
MQAPARGAQHQSLAAARVERVGEEGWHRARCLQPRSSALAAAVIVGWRHARLFEEARPVFGRVTVDGQHLVEEWSPSGRVGVASGQGGAIGVWSSCWRADASRRGGNGGQHREAEAGIIRRRPMLGGSGGARERSGERELVRKRESSFREGRVRVGVQDPCGSETQGQGHGVDFGAMVVSMVGLARSMPRSLY